MRSVSLPSTISGRLYLSAMPGRHRPFQEMLDSITGHAVIRIVCLVSANEIESQSVMYAGALKQGTMPCPVLSFPVSDFDAPTNRDGYVRLACEVSASLKRGENILVHCGEGIGRTGTFAVSVLLALGTGLPQATGMVRTAGSHPESTQQEKFLLWIAKQLAQDLGMQ